MTLPVNFGSLASGNQSTTLFDTQFNALGAASVIACTAIGSNAVALTPATNYFSPAGYTDSSPFFTWVQQTTSTGPVTINVAGLGALNAYKMNGSAVLGAGDIVTGQSYICMYNHLLNAGAGGFVVNVEIGAGGFITEAPIDGSLYGRQNAAWHQVGTTPDIGRNKLHNALFNIQQRGQGPWTVAAFTADRWRQFIGSGDTISTSLYSLADVDRAQIGDEEAQFTPGIVFTGASTSTSQVTYWQNIEGLRRTAGKTVTVSFWARSVSGTPKIGVLYAQSFGTGGSPSATVLANIGVTPALTGTFTRYTMTAALPSISGKTVGTNGDDCLAIQFFLSCAPSNVNSGAAGNIGVQSGNVNFWGMQLEIGSQATPLEKLDQRNDLANCQRFYQVGNMVMTSAYVGSTFGGAISNWTFPVVMRATPSIGIFSVSGPGPGVQAQTITFANVLFAFSGAGATAVAQYNAWNFTASADL